jgi:hypothetical protein
MRCLIGRIAVSSALAFGCVVSCSETITGHVVAITDGDTITVLDTTKTQPKPQESESQN